MTHFQSHFYFIQKAFEIVIFLKAYHSNPKILDLHSFFHFEVLRQNFLHIRSICFIFVSKNQNLSSFLLFKSLFEINIYPLFCLKSSKNMFSLFIWTYPWQFDWIFEFLFLIWSEKCFLMMNQFFLKNMWQSQPICFLIYYEGWKVVFLHDLRVFPPLGWNLSDCGI